MKRKTRIIAGILLVLYLALVGFLCFAQFDKLPAVGKTFLGIEVDKLVHFAMFLPMPPLLYLTYGRIIPRFGQALAVTLVTFIIGCIVAAGTELGQGLTAYRSADPKDFMADILALGISAIITLIFNQIKSRQHP